MPRPREPPVFFIDHCLGTEKVAERLRRAGGEARVMIEEGFPEDAEDASWLPGCGGQRMGGPHERQANQAPLYRARRYRRLGRWRFHPGRRRDWGRSDCRAFARALPRMIQIWQTRQRPFIATITAQGKVTLIESGNRLGGAKRI